jgi:DNA-binding NtrC family response regulator
MKPASLLLVDDDRHVLHSMAEWLREIGFRVDTGFGVADAKAALDRRGFDLVLVDVRLADGDGFDVLAHSRQKHPDTPVVLITGYGSVETAVDAIRAGAFDFLTKPIIDEELEMSIRRALNQRKLVEENRNLAAQLDARYGLEHIVGHDRRMTRVFEMIDSVADTKATVLITGESGTGKSMIARAIHRRSSRRDARGKLGKDHRRLLERILEQPSPVDQGVRRRIARIGSRRLTVSRRCAVQHPDHRERTARVGVLPEGGVVWIGPHIDLDR